MSIKVASNRFIVSSFWKYAGFYQQIRSGVLSLRQLGDELVCATEIAQAYRQKSKVEEQGSVLSNFPIREYRLIGQYYLGWCAYRKGEGTPTVFENVVELSKTYRAKALWSLAAIEASKGNYEAELTHLKESLKYANDLATKIELAKGMSVVKAKEGFHAQALKDLESIVPLIRYAKPHIYYDCLNSFAVELAEVGRLEEARNISNIVLASPYAFAYPEWRETSDEIDLKAYRSSRSFVAITQGVTQDNIVRLPERASSSIIQDEPGRVLYPDWETMGKKAKNDTPEIPKDMNVADMIIMVMNLMSKEGNATEDKMRKLLDYAIKLFSK